MHSFSTDQAGRHNRYLLMGGIAAGVLFAGSALFGALGIVSFGAAAGAIYYVFANFIWKWSKVQEYGIVDVPDLNGTWDGYLYTSADPEKIDDSLIIEDGDQLDNFTKQEASLHISQSWDKIEITFDGPESRSYSKGATILVDEKAWPTLTYNFLNKGGKTNSNLDMHYGTTALEYHEEDDSLEGRYYTRPDQRGTHGILELTRTD